MKAGPMPAVQPASFNSLHPLLPHAATASLRARTAALGQTPSASASASTWVLPRGRCPSCLLMARKVGAAARLLWVCFHGVVACLSSTVACAVRWLVALAVHVPHVLRPFNRPFMPGCDMLLEVPAQLVMRRSKMRSCSAQSGSWLSWRCWVLGAPLTCTPKPWRCARKPGLLAKLGLLLLVCVGRASGSLSGKREARRAGPRWCLGPCTHKAHLQLVSVCCVSQWRPLPRRQ